VSDPCQYLFSPVEVNKLDKLPLKISLAFSKEALIFGRQSCDGWDSDLSGENGILSMLKGWTLYIDHMTGVAYNKI
jgi:hypothetical protein